MLAWSGGSLGVSPGRFAERSLRHPGFAHSCILAFALRASLDCKAGSFGPGSPLAYGLKDGLFAASRRSAAGGGDEGRVGWRRGAWGAAGGWQAGRVFGCRRRIERDGSSGAGGVERDGSSGAGGTSAKPRPLRGPRTRPACVCIRFAARGPVPLACVFASRPEDPSRLRVYPLRGPRTRPVPFPDKEVEARRVGERSRSV